MDLSAVDVDKLSSEELSELYSIVSKLAEAERHELAQKDFMAFVKAMWPGFIEGAHHKRMADAFQRVVEGKCKRLIINMPPRHTKSEFASYLLPAWFLGLYPDKKIIQSAHTAELAVGFGRKVRNLVGSDEYKSVFPETSLSSDSKAAGRWNTNRKGEYFAIGVGGSVTGKGADLFIIDDPHSEQDAMHQSMLDLSWEWYTSGPRQRLQPGGAIVIVMTRWSTRDLTGRVLKAQMDDPMADQWEVIELPALLPSGRSLWPEFWTTKELEKIKASLPVHKWQSQYQQAPTAEEGALIKREWWSTWAEPKPPTCDFVIQSWDTAYLKSEMADYSACTTWGVFMSEKERKTKIGEDDNGDPLYSVKTEVKPHVILLHAMKGRWEFPELKRIALDHYKSWSPDGFIVEAKAAGTPLIAELRNMGIPVMEFSPTRGNDKIARVNAVSDMFSSGFVYAPEKRWAEEVIEECAAFPNGDHDDYVDSTTQALLRIRQGGFIQMMDDDFLDEKDFVPRRAAYY